MSVHEAMELVINYKNLIVGSMFRCLLLALLLMFSVSTIGASHGWYLSQYRAIPKYACVDPEELARKEYESDIEYKRISFSDFYEIFDDTDGDQAQNPECLFNVDKKCEQLKIEKLTKAAIQGDFQAQSDLGWVYINGDCVQRDMKTAFNWISKSAKQGHSGAQASLGAMYYNGESVLTDYMRAYMWSNLSSYNGNIAGQKLKHGLRPKLLPSEIKMAQDMSSRCLESGYTDC